MTPTLHDLRDHAVASEETSSTPIPPPTVASLERLCEHLSAAAGLVGASTGVDDRFNSLLVYAALDAYGPAVMGERVGLAEGAFARLVEDFEREANMQLAAAADLVREVSLHELPDSEDE